MDIVHCYDAINKYAQWYPLFQKQCFNRERLLPAVKALRLPLVEKAKDISQHQLILMIYTDLSKYISDLLAFSIAHTENTSSMSHFSTIFFRSLQPKLSQVMNTICIIKS